MGKWREFLESLNSAGGAIFILWCGLLMFSTAAVLVAILLPAKEAVYLMFANIVGNFSGSLFTVIRIKSGAPAVDASGSKDIEVNVQKPA